VKISRKKICREKQKKKKSEEMREKTKDGRVSRRKGEKGGEGFTAEKCNYKQWATSKSHQPEQRIISKQGQRDRLVQ